MCGWRLGRARWHKAGCWQPPTPQSQQGVSLSSLEAILNIELELYSSMALKHVSKVYRVKETELTRNQSLWPQASDRGRTCYRQCENKVESRDRLMFMPDVWGQRDWLQNIYFVSIHLGTQQLHAKWQRRHKCSGILILKPLQVLSLVCPDQHSRGFKTFHPCPLVFRNREDLGRFGKIQQVSHIPLKC